MDPVQLAAYAQWSHNTVIGIVLQVIPSSSSIPHPGGALVTETPLPEESAGTSWAKETAQEEARDKEEGELGNENADSEATIPFPLGSASTSKESSVTGDHNWEDDDSGTDGSTTIDIEFEEKEAAEAAEITK